MADSSNEIQGPSSSIFSRAAGTVGGIINSARDASYSPGVADSESGKQDISPGMTVNAGGKKLNVMGYLHHSKNGAVWRVKDESGKMYEYVAPLK